MEALYLLALIACPAAMGAMMWWMARGARRGGEPHDRSRSEGHAARTPSPEAAAPGATAQHDGEKAR